MKKIYLIAMIMIIAIINVNAQTYNIQQTIGTGSDYSYTSASNTIISGGNQVLSPLQTIPFDFTFYGQTVTNYIASDNGYITFNSATISNEMNTSLPSTNAPMNAIFAFWDDLNLANGTSVPDKVVNFTYGTAPNRVHVIQWHSVTPLSGTGYLYAAIRIYENPCGIDFDVVNPYGNATGMSATIGCQNSTGTDGSQTLSSPNEDYPGTAVSNSDDVVYSFSPSNYTYDMTTVSEINLNEVMTVSTINNLDIQVQNNGSQSISSFNLNYSINGGAVQTDNIITGITSGGTSNLLHSIPFNPSNAGQYYEFKIWCDNINGNNDELNCNDTLTKLVWVNLGVSGTKKVLLEEFTTESCQFCPDGTFVVEEITSQNPYVIAVAHHSGFGSDFLTTAFHEDYADDMTSGAPKAAIDRFDFTKDGSKVAISRSNNGWLDAVIDMNNYPTPVNISIDGISYNNVSNTVSAEVNVSFIDYAQPGDISLTLWVIEDSIDPISQTNYYSGDQSHPYGNLPSTITAANANEYQHRHTSKKISTATWGDPIGNSNPVPGDTYQRVFNNISLNGTDPGQVYLVATLSYDNPDITKRLVLNSNKQYVEGMVATIENYSLENKINIFPNPITQIGYVEFQLKKSDVVKLTIYNLLAEEIISKEERKYSQGNHAIAINTYDLPTGTYFVEIKTSNQVERKKFTVVK